MIQGAPLNARFQNVGTRATLAPGGVSSAAQVYAPSDSPLVFGVTLSLALTQIQVAADIIRAAATIDFGVQGATAQVVCDVVDGCTLSIPASSCTIRMTHEGAGQSLILGASVAYLPKPNNFGAQRTLFTAGDAQIASPGTADFPVPNFARKVSVFRTPVAQPYTLEFRQFATSSNDFYEVNVPAGADAQGILIANGIQSVRIKNPAMGAPLLHVRVVFELGL